VTPRRGLGRTISIVWSTSTLLRTLTSGITPLTRVFYRRWHPGFGNGLVSALPESLSASP